MSGYNSTFFLWKRVRIGGANRKAEDYIREMETLSIRITVRALTVIESPEFEISSKRRSVGLASLCGRHLGLRRAYSIEDLFNRIKRLGARLCPAEAALALRIAYLKQPSDGFLIVAMEPILGTAGTYMLLNLACDAGRIRIGAMQVSRNTFFGADDRFIVAL